MRRLGLFFAAILAACASGPAGPTSETFAELIASERSVPSIRNLHCAFVAEEGSEWVCRYQEQATAGGWVGLSAVIARDGDRWILIDAVCTADQALADRGRCRR